MDNVIFTIRKDPVNHICFVKTFEKCDFAFGNAYYSSYILLVFF